MDTVADHMSSPLISISEDASLSEVQKIFLEKDINHLPVLDAQGKVAGMLSSTDLSKLSNWRSLFRPNEIPELSQQLLNSLLVSELMVKPVITIAKSASLKDAAEKIRGRSFHALPVVDDNGKVVGIITAHDLLRAAFGV